MAIRIIFSAGQLGITISEKSDLNVLNLRVHTIMLHIYTPGQVGGYPWDGDVPSISTIAGRYRDNVNVNDPARAPKWTQKCSKSITW